MYPPWVREKIEFANKRRQNPTEAERMLEGFMAGRFGSDAFLCEWVVGQYIADFYFPKERVVVEVDGTFHDTIEQWVKDRHRDTEMARRGILVLRFRNEDVFSRSGWVIARIEAALASRARFS